MKKALMTMTALAVVGASAPRVEAGDKEWATAGKVMAGVGAGLLIAKALEPRPVVYETPTVYQSAPAPVVYQPAPTPVVYQPAPVVVQSQPSVVYAPPAQTVVVQQPAVVYQPAPTVIYRPAPVVYAAPVVAPRYFAPRPVVGFHFSFGRHHGHHYRGHHGGHGHHGHHGHHGRGHRR